MRLDQGGQAQLEVVDRVGFAAGESKTSSRSDLCSMAPLLPRLIHVYSDTFQRAS